MLTLEALWTTCILLWEISGGSKSSRDVFHHKVEQWLMYYFMTAKELSVLLWKSRYAAVLGLAEISWGGNRLHHHFDTISDMKCRLQP